MTVNKGENSEDSKLSRPAKIVLILAASPLIIWFAIGVGTRIINEKFGNRECWYKEEYLDLNFNGIIQVKGLDQKNHNYPFIDIVNSKKSTEHIFLIFKKEQVWDKLEVKDQISKHKGTLDFEIRRDTVTTILIPSFDCDADDFWL